MDPSKLFEFLKGEWAVFWSAPVLFLASASIFGVGGFLLARLRHEGKVDVLNERITARDEEIARLTERVAMMPAPGTPYSRLTHAEFRKEVVEFVRALRTDLARWRHLELKRREGDMHAMRVAADDATRTRLFHDQCEAMEQVSAHIVGEYASKYKAKALVLRDELISRGTRVNQIERRIPSQTVNLMYEIANGQIAFESVADDLEQRAAVLG